MKNNLTCKKRIGLLLMIFFCSALLLGAVSYGAEADETKTVASSLDRNLYRDKKLIPGGIPFGVRLYCEGALVVGLDSFPSGGKNVSPAEKAGIRKGDLITEADGCPIKNVGDFVNLVEASEGKSLTVLVLRDGKEMRFSLTPMFSDKDRKMKTGLMIRDSTAGIGTVTYIDPDSGSFAGLGHGVCDTDTGELMPLLRGSVVNVTVSGIVKGQVGDPGELKGYFSSGKIGSLLGNTECGVFGLLAELPRGTVARENALPIAFAEEIKAGKAELLCTLKDGGIGHYQVMISEIDRSGRDTKNFTVTVTDPVLLAETGGIVQGMSGSPLIQNGKLIGAVTHVLVNDPVRGYGIFIENMLTSAPEILR